jgi:hypothetical protein
MSLRKEQTIFLMNVCKLIEFATQQGFEVTGGELWRPPEMQKIYVQTGRSKTMNSRHLSRKAIDLNFFLDNKYYLNIDGLRPIGAYWESLNPKNKWGGNYKSFKDVPHFEML